MCWDQTDEPFINFVCRDRTKQLSVNCYFSQFANVFAHQRNNVFQAGRALLFLAETKGDRRRCGAILNQNVLNPGERGTPSCKTKILRKRIHPLLNLITSYLPRSAVIFSSYAPTSSSIHKTLNFAGFTCLSLSLINYTALERCYQWRNVTKVKGQVLRQ